MNAEISWIIFFSPNTKSLDSMTLRNTTVVTVLRFSHPIFKLFENDFAHIFKMHWNLEELLSDSFDDSRRHLAISKKIKRSIHRCKIIFHVGSSRIFNFVQFSLKNCTGFGKSKAINATHRLPRFPRFRIWT